MPNYAQIFVQKFRYYTGTILAVQPIFGDIACLGLSVKQRQSESKVVYGGGVRLGKRLKADFASRKHYGM